MALLCLCCQRLALLFGFLPLPRELFLLLPSALFFLCLLLPEALGGSLRLLLRCALFLQLVIQLHLRNGAADGLLNHAQIRLEKLAARRAAEAA